MAIVSTPKKACANLIFALANLVIADREDNQQPTPDTWRTTEAGLQVRPPQLH